MGWVTLFHSKILYSDQCQICKNIKEDTLLALCDCLHASEIWNFFNVSISSSIGDLEPWLKANLSLKIKSIYSGILCITL